MERQMTLELLKQWAKQTGDCTADERGRETFSFDEYGLQALAALVAAHEREQIANNHLDMAVKYANLVQAITDPENQPSQHGTVTLQYLREAIATEREQCALVCDQYDLEHRLAQNTSQAIACAAAIRERRL
jgi:hypothetical protein